jgi:hypothetical protein
MLFKVLKPVQLIKNMGWRYILFRLRFEACKKFGLLKKKFPADPEFKNYYTLAAWRAKKSPFFFESKDQIKVNGSVSKELENDYKKISANVFKFFSSLEFDLGLDYNWVTNPDSGYCYDSDTHWLDVNDYSETSGDIKFVWEPSRFSHLYTLIRYDKYTGNDCSEQVFSEIEKWIDHNKINLGPNFKCSQEISLRSLNWIFALYYYSNSPNLTEKRFAKIQYYLYWQIKHVYDNIDFSRIAVRNNHAITETLALYSVGMLFPDLPDATKWKTDGKRWFEEEVIYQIYQDGTYLQFSTNYHRVVIQLLTWGIKLAQVNNDSFDSLVYDRAKKSLFFLQSLMNEHTGWLPNYGSNDGALFFKLNNNHYRDYRPQLAALSAVLELDSGKEIYEDINWFGITPQPATSNFTLKNGSYKFEKGGYYIFRLKDSVSFVRCGNHEDRPAQADNLHLDIWYKNLNILHDGGSYKYNSTTTDLKYFMGTRSHNTVMLDDFDQMQKGPRFIWYDWTQTEAVEITETEDYYYFKGTIKAFQHLSKDIRHTRAITINKKDAIWEIEDYITAKPDNIMLTQLWHTSYLEKIEFKAKAANGLELNPIVADGFTSTFYGQKDRCTELSFSTYTNRIKTIITINNENTTTASIFS